MGMRLFSNTMNQNNFYIYIIRYIKFDFDLNRKICSGEFKFILE